MGKADNVFEKTYRDYLAEIAKCDFSALARPLGIQFNDKASIVPVFGRPYRVSAEGMADPEGRRPNMVICVILSKYLLLCPDNDPEAGDWTAYRDFKDSGPLTVYFQNDVIRLIVERFSNRLDALWQAALTLDGVVPAAPFNNDLAISFTALPRVPMLLLFNNPDDEFPASCSVLFRKNAENYLDGECLAMLGSYLATALIKAD